MTFNKLFMGQMHPHKEEIKRPNPFILKHLKINNIAAFQSESLLNFL